MRQCRVADEWLSQANLVACDKGLLSTTILFSGGTTTADTVIARAFGWSSEALDEIKSIGGCRSMR